MIKGAVFADDDNYMLDGSGSRRSSCLGVGGLGQSRKHLQRNEHHRAALQSPVRGIDSTFQGDTSRKLKKQHDKRRGSGNRDVSNENEMIDNCDYGTGGISSQKIVIGIEQLFHSSNASGCGQG